MRFQRLASQSRVELGHGQAVLPQQGRNNQSHGSSNGSSNDQPNQNRNRLNKSFGKDVDQEDSQNSDSCKQKALTSWLWNIISHISDSDWNQGQSNRGNNRSCYDRWEEIGHFWEDAWNKNHVNPWCDKGTKHSATTMALPNHNQGSDWLEGYS